MKSYVMMKKTHLRTKSDTNILGFNMIRINFYFKDVRSTIHYMADRHLRTN